ncbi:MAG: carbon-nitrogen hydrolase family protein [Firmicutes bacterium]|nr:carbon-nitrogen hydrolase family protein [Bacillota bacterium]
MRGTFRIGVCQMQVGERKEENIFKALAMIQEASANGSRLVVLPEMFNCPYDSTLFPVFAEEYPNGETIQMLSRAARKENIYLIGGSIPELEGSTVYNTSFIFGTRGELLAKHQKIHLFDVDLAGGISFKESQTLGYGKKVTVVETEVCTLGVAICYDIRFPELSRLMALAKAELIVIPAAFNMTTGPAHWELLLRARAVDNQVFVVGAAPARNNNASYVSYGHSAVVDPWGQIIAGSGEKETILYGDIDLRRVTKIRQELPLLKHRRLDLYELKHL